MKRYPIKSCPWCKGTSISVGGSECPSDGRAALCNTCGASGPFDTKTKFKGPISAWNTRPWEEETAGLQARWDRIFGLRDVARYYGDGDTPALWERIEDFREGREGREGRAAPSKLSETDVRELVEWWAEIHETMMDLDEKCSAAEARAAAAEAANGDEPT